MEAGGSLVPEAQGSGSWMPADAPMALESMDWMCLRYTFVVLELGVEADVV